MPAGRPRKPVEQKRRTGNPGKRPLARLAAVPAIEVSAWELDPDLALERVLRAGVSWLAETDAPKLALLRDALWALQIAKSVGSARGVLEAIKVAGPLMAELGFDPAARARLGLAEVKTLSKLEEMRARSQAKVADAGPSRRRPTG